MGILQRIDNALIQMMVRERAVAPAPISLVPDRAVFGAGAFGASPENHERLLREMSGTADAASRALADRIASLKPLVKVTRSAGDGTTEDEILDDHPLAILLANPHPNFSWRMLMTLVGEWMATVGEAYLVKEGNSFVPTRLHPVSPHMMEPLVRDGVIAAYRVTDANGKQETLDAEGFIRIWRPRPDQPWKSRGILEPSALEFDAHKFASQHLRRMYQHDATPKLALEAQEGAQEFTDSQRTRMQQLWRDLYSSRSGTSQGAPAIIPTFYKIRELAMQTGADITPLMEHLQKSLLMDFRTPKAVLGEIDAGDRSSAEVQHWGYDKIAVQPVADAISDALTHQLARDFDEAIFVDWQPYISKDKEFELEREAQDLEHGVRTINMILKERGMAPVPWGDEPLLHTRLRRLSDPLPGQMPAAQAPDIPTGVEPEEDEGEDDPERLERLVHIHARRLARANRRRRKAG